MSGPTAPRGRAAEVLAAFARLGVTSFGGPVAHVGWFREEFVVRRRWLGEREFADLVALCQFLPGPASSKLGFTIGLVRAGWAGGLAAWAAFTLPSAALLLAFASGAGAIARSGWGAGLLHGLQLTAVAVVAHAVWSMARGLCPDGPRRAIAAAAAAFALLAPTAIAQLGAILLGALAGTLACRGTVPAAPAPAAAPPVSRRAGLVAAVLFAALLAFSSWPHGDTAAGMFAAFYRSGALVFGGGHVVLPLLDGAVAARGWIDREAFVAGYGAAQAVPGPLFTFAAYLGASPAAPVSGFAGAGLALVAIFLPGLLLQLAALPTWGRVQRRPAAQAAMRGVNAAVVGILAAALYSPVWTGGVHSPVDAGIAVAGFLLLVVARAPALLVVALTAGAGVVGTALG